ncbi:Serine-aspartate repeat-containing protein D precursor [Posidoniimonas polymericola]|uniref:Serine-aspartate repeat-containing protein D n=1 Tax=Posidoniimonas polymericola TaxID=2528002 RepID=A0A5C5YQ50_9BACT|nr:SdrD B-like domain-containing protein [Posidoniimonas polymericola]TWT77035.1 Serine-aspartate repeat-containing protein D precursor [Posidoniimonas polymericola]
MGLLKLFGFHAADAAVPATRNRVRRAYLEQLESRELLAADGLAPEVLLGGVYFEEATGDDSQADILQISFVGGPAGTTLDKITISGDKFGDGLTSGDNFFDTVDGGLGWFKSVGYALVSADGFDITSVALVDGGTDVVFTFDGFDAGEKLIFSVDWDEAQAVNPAGQLVLQNSLVEGAEFELNTLIGEFTAPGYVDLTLSGLYYDDFDGHRLTAETTVGLTLDLPNDRYTVDHDYTDRTAGAVAHAPMLELATLSGFVYHDLNDDGVFDPNESPIAGVELKLLDANGADTGLRAVTNADGYYKFVDLEPGKYTVMEFHPDGWVDGKDTPGTHGGLAADESAGPVDMISSVMLTYGDHAEEYNFGEILLASIGGFVMASHGPDCDFDNPDELLEGVKIELLNEAGVVVATAYTNAQGRYKFEGLKPGKYSVREYTPNGYFDGEERVGTVGGTVSDDLISNITLLSGQDGTNYDFCEHVGATLAGYVYHDASNDGQFDPTEDPIPGVELKLIDGQGVDTGKRAYTDANGYYQFTDLAPGKYTVMENQPAAWLDGKDTIGSHGGTVSNDMLSNAMLQFGDNAVNYNFGELLAASIAGRVSAFTGPDCDPDNPEILVEGVQIDLLDAQGNLLATTYTDANGEYKFEGLRPGEYQVKEHQPTEYFDGDEHLGSAGGNVSDDHFTAVQLDSGEDATRYDFCEHVGATLSGYVYHDRSDDGSYDRSTEESIAGVTLKLYKDGVDTGRTSITDANGYYRFSDLDAGSYTVVELHPAGWLDGKDTPGSHGGTADAPGDAIRQITLTYGDDSVENNFGELLPASIAGRVSAFTGPDCDPENPEILVEGVQIDLLDAAGNLLATTYTDANGEYSFVGLRPGEYQVKEHQPTEYFDGDEHVGSAGGLVSDDHFSGVQLGSGEDATRYDFCEHVGAKLSGYVYHDQSNDGVFDPTEDPIGGVTLKLIGADGEDTGLRATTNSAGYYEFDNLAAGTYAVMEIHPTAWLDGKDTPGSTGGTADNPGDMISQIVITYGDHSAENNFGELLAASIAGRVSAFTGPDCDPDNPEILVEGVQIDLLDAQGNLLATTYTDANGEYKFEGLRPGEYQVKEHQPTEYFDGDEHLGSAGGNVSDDHFTAVQLDSGEDATRYDFCEHVGATLSGYVYHDRSDDGSYDRSTEESIAGVTLKLYKDGVDTGRTSITDANGYYRFSDLDAGSYTVVELHPAGWLDGKDTPGSHGGTADAPGDAIRQITLTYGDDSVENNFGELLPGSIRGKVVVSTDPDCDPDDGEPPIEGVKIELLNEHGEVIQTTYTDANGEYAFTGLAPAAYTVRETQPVDYFHADQHVGDGGGAYFGQDVIGDVHVGSDQHWDNYDFCETPPASLSGYVFIDGAPIVTLEDIAPEDVASYRNGLRSADDTPLAGVVVELRNGFSGDPIFGEQALPGYYPDGPIRAVTDANGYYRFDGLPGGNYAVVEIQPENLIDGVDTVGTLGGIAINPLPPTEKELIAFDEIPTPGQMTIEQFRTNFGDNAIVRVPLQAGQHSAENNFSEVRTTRFYVPPETPPETPPPFIVGSPMYLPPRVVGEFRNAPTPPPTFYGASEALGWTWHLSVVNAGHPRAATAHGPTMILARSQFDAAAWESGELKEAEWTLVQDDQDNQRRQRFHFGEADGIPVVGDWNGDGIAEIGVFTDGYWRLDLNGNGVWDRGDLWAKLGTREDLPVTGDWDGDGKTDIGIYGPAWPRDPHAIAREPGLPDADNYPTSIAGKAKNVPPTPEDATSGGRLLRRTASGASRADLIDHVFHYGTPGDQPVAGDWNGDGIRAIGVYRDGVWILDMDGDGRFTDRDQTFVFGTMGDLPVVGDWDGDGVDDLGVYRAGRWLVDSNSNRELDAKDTAFELGAPGDTPIAGDWDGDGADEPAVYGPKEPTVRVSQKAG